jgi:hypothetical protein
MPSLRTALAGRRVRTTTLAVTLVAASLAVWQGVAAAAPQAVMKKVSSPIQFQNANCGSSTSGAQIGKATISRKHDTLKITWKLTAGLPNTTYDVQLWESAPTACTMIADLGNIVTNSHGKVSKKFTYSSVAGSTQVFTTGWDGSNYNDSLTVSI